MSNIQEIIAAKILANDKKIEEKFQASNFVLNTDIAELMRENEELQLQCPHTFENGYCIYCRKGENA